MSAAEHFIAFFAMSLINQLYRSTDVRLYLSHELKNHTFWRESVKILPSFIQRYNGRHYATLLNL